jgi:fumarate reductase subunit D
MSDNAQESTSKPATERRENIWLNLLFNLAGPILLLTKGEKWFAFLTAPQVLIVALLFPIGYFLYDLKTRKKVNGLSVLGFISVLLTGGIGLLKLSPTVFAIKETLLPLIMGVAVVASLKTKKPFIRMFLLNPSVLDTAKLEAHLDTPDKRTLFQQVLVRCTWIFAASFLVSAAMNFTLTRMIVTTDPNLDQAAYNAELGTQTWVSWLVMTVLTLPLMVMSMWVLFKGIRELTGLGMEDLMHDAKKDTAPAKAEE